jgi:prevent-host-death family protein
MLANHAQGHIPGRCTAWFAWVRLDEQYLLDHYWYRKQYRLRFVMNTLTAAELKRRGMAAIEEGLRRGPIRIVKRNRPAAVVISEDEYARLAQNNAVAPTGMTALQWLLSHPAIKGRKKADIDTALRVERDGWQKA